MQNNNISCIIFDFDGVIANTDLGRYNILKKILNDFDESDFVPFNHKDLIGLSTKGFLNKISKKLTDSQIADIIKKRHEIFFSNLNEFCIPYEKMQDTIKDLCTKFDLAITTTNDVDNVKVQLDYLGILHCFKWIIGRDFTENSNLEKTYHKIPQILQRMVSECIVVEDSDFGVNAAKKEGFYCIRFDPDNLFSKGLEDERVFNYNEIREVINKNTTCQHRV